MTKQQDDKDRGSPLPMKGIVISISLLFFIFVIGFMILPAYFDETPFGKLFHNEPAPWALTQEEQKKFNYNDIQLKGRQNYLEYCASCHGPNGKGDGPSSLTLRKKPPRFISPSSKFINDFNKQGLLKTLNEGIPNSEMLSYHYLPTETKEQIVEFLLFMKNNQGFY